MNADFLKKFIAKLNDAQNVLVMGHKNSDADSIGSVLGLAHLLRGNLGKRVDCSYDGAFPDFLDFLPGREDLIYAKKIGFAGKYDLAVVLDTPAAKMLGETQEELLRVVGTSIKIDHHVSQPEEDFADLSLVDPSRGSTAEIVLHIAEALSWRVDKVAAECLFAGAASDSGWFKYSKSGESLRAAGALIDFGADARNIAQNLEMQTKKDILIEAIAVANAEFFYKDRLVVAMITKEMYKNLNGKAELAMDLLCRIKAVEYVAVIKEAAPGRIHVSFRSKTSPVRGVAEKFGGGGHDFAAAANLEGEPGAIKAAVVAAFANL